MAVSKQNWTIVLPWWYKQWFGWFERLLAPRKSNYTEGQYASAVVSCVLKVEKEEQISERLLIMH
jgi:hypothetical protein